jgi:predicted AAA+ superfamily ATPase
MFKRTMQKVIEKTSKTFPVLLLTGPRQVGKTFLMESLAGKNRRYVSLDDLRARETARIDPERFIQENPPPVIIDGVQYAPSYLLT